MSPLDLPSAAPERKARATDSQLTRGTFYDAASAPRTHARNAARATRSMSPGLGRRAGLAAAIAAATSSSPRRELAHAAPRHSDFPANSQQRAIATPHKQTRRHAPQTTRARRLDCGDSRRSVVQPAARADACRTTPFLSRRQPYENGRGRTSTTRSAAPS